MRGKENVLFMYNKCRVERKGVYKKM